MFRFSTATALLLLAASAAAYQVTKPADKDVWDPSQPQIIAWTKVETDAESFAITLVHQASQPNTRTLLEADVDGGQGSITVNPPTGGWPSGSAYQINLVRDENNLDAILAQSQQFDIKASTGSSGSASQSSSAGSTASSLSRASSTVSGTRTSASTVPPSNSNSPSGTTDDDLNPSSTGSLTTGNNNSASSFGVQTGLFGLVAMVGALLA